MKNTKITFFFAALLSITPFFARAQATAASSNCIQREDEMTDAPKIKSFVAKLGGVASLEGEWKLGGLVGKLKHVVISFESASDGMKALIDGLDESSDSDGAWGPISVCDTVRSDTLQVKVLKTQDSLYMRLGAGGSLQLAQIQGGKVGTFYSFNKSN